MKIACIAFTYFAFGGLQRDLIDISRALRKSGHQVKLYVGVQKDDAPDDVDMECLNARGFSNFQRDQNCHRRFMKAMEAFQPDCIVGFNKMPDLDAYYAADSCFGHRMKNAWFKKHLPRYQHYCNFEAAVFSTSSRTHSFVISAAESDRYQAVYGTPDERITLLPPGIRPDRKAPDNFTEQRRHIRASWHLKENDCILLMVGSGFRTKGLDRSIECLASLPTQAKKRTRLFVVGEDNPRRFKALIRRYRLDDHVEFFGGRTDVHRFFLGADVLIHPAYRENTGTVLLEAMIAGCPVIASGACGYAHYINKAKAGVVITEPFSQHMFNDTVLELIQSPTTRQTMSQRGIIFGQTADIYHRDTHFVSTLETLMKQRQASQKGP